MTEKGNKQPAHRIGIAETKPPQNCPALFRGHLADANTALTPQEQRMDIQQWVSHERGKHIQFQTSPVHFTRACPSCPSHASPVMSGLPAICCVRSHVTTPTEVAFFLFIFIFFFAGRTKIPGFSHMHLRNRRTPRSHCMRKWG